MWPRGSCLVVLLVTAVVADYPDAVPNGVQDLSISTDTSWYKNQLSFDLSFSAASSGPATCGFHIRVGVDVEDNSGPLLLDVAGTSFNDSFTDVFARQYSGDTAPAVSITVSDDNSDGNDEVAVSRTGTFITDSGVSDRYYILVFPYNCETNRAFNLTPSAIEITDLYYPYYAPLIETTRTDLSRFAFTDTSSETGKYSGTFKLFTQHALEAEFGTTGYIVFSNSTCTALPGCPVDDAPADATALSASSNGVWTVTLADFALYGNVIYVASTNDNGDMSVERRLRVTDFRPAPEAVTDLYNFTSTNFLPVYTPEKLIWDDAGTHRLDLNFGDQMKLGYEADDSLQSPTSSFHFQWQVFTGGRWHDLSNENAATIGDKFMTTGLAGTYRVTAYVDDVGVAEPYWTDTFTSEELAVSVSANPQTPESGLPQNIAFTDTEIAAQYIGGVLTFDESTDPAYHTALDNRQFEFYLVHLSTQPNCSLSVTNADANTVAGTCADGTGRSSGDTRLGVVAYTAGAIEFTVPRTFIGDDQVYIHVTAYDSTGAGAESVNTLTHTVADVQQDASQPVPSQSAGVGFYDKDGAARQIKGKIEFQLDAAEDFSSVDQFEVYQFHSPSFAAITDLDDFNAAGAIATFKMPATWDGDTVFSMWLGTFDNELGSEADDPDQAFSLDAADGTHLDYLLIVSRTAQNDVNPALGGVPSSTAAYVFVNDRVDAYYFVNHMASRTGMCPNPYCVGGPSSDTVRYWPHAEQAEGTDGQVTVYWLAPSLDNMLYELDEAAFPAWAGYLDNSALDDMSGTFGYSLTIGAASGDAGCDMQATASWPFGAPAAWDSVDLTHHTLFYTTADYQGLKACGFQDDASVRGGIALTGMLTLELLPVASRTDSDGATVGAQDSQLTIQAQLVVTFDDDTHASISAVSVQNVLVVDSVTAGVTVGSTISFYDVAFLGRIDTAATVFSAGSDTFYLEHALTSNADEFYMDLERMWFSPGSAVTDRVEFLVPPSSPAFTNADSPASPGRYRIVMDVPYLLNCKPCYLHLVSTLSTASSKKALVDPAVARSARSAVPIFVDVGEGSNGATCAHVTLVGAAMSLVAARF